MLTTEYKQRPAGKIKKKIEKTTGIYFITCAWVGSVVGGAGLSFCVENIINPNTTGSTNKGSGMERSDIQ